jgi:AcrR family transcriptional regulator
VADSPRERIVASAATLIRERGLARTGLRDVVAHARAPWGSLSHYFPRGKTQIAEEAVRWMGGLVRAELDGAVAAGDPEHALRYFAGLWRDVVVDTDARAGCTIAAVVGDAEDDGLRLVAAEVFRSWREPFVAALRERGVPADRARRLGTTIVAALEGALVLCRAERSPDPLLETARELEVLVNAALPGRRGSEPSPIGPTAGDGPVP